MNALFRTTRTRILSFILLFININLCHAQSWVPASEGLLESYQWNSGFDINFKPEGPLGRDWIYGHWLDSDSVVRCVGYREGGKWVPLPFSGNFNCWTGDIVQYGDTMYIGGNFDGIVLDKDSSRLPPCHVLKYYNDSLWTSSVAMSLIMDMEASGDSLLIAGSLYMGPDTSFGPHVLTTDKEVSWHFPYSSMNPISNSLNSGPWVNVELRNGDIYVLNDGIDQYDGVVRWDGLQWHTYGPGIFGTYSQAYDFEFYKDELYMGGSFSKSEDPRNPGERIAKWNGMNWEEVGGGLTSSIWSLFEHEGILYCHITGDRFGDATISNLAGWDGYQWCGTPTSYIGGAPVNFGYINDTLFSVNKYHPVTANGDTLSYLNYFDGDYVNGPDAICSTLGIGMEDEITVAAQLKIFPNPASSLLEVSLVEGNIEHVKIYNLSGKCIFQEVYRGSSAVEVDISHLSNGIYIIEVNNWYNEKVVKM